MAKQLNAFEQQIWAAAYGTKIADGKAVEIAIRAANQAVLRLREKMDVSPYGTSRDDLIEGVKALLV